MNALSKSVQYLLQLLCLFTVYQFQFYGAALGGEKAKFTEPQLTPNTNHRQNLCGRLRELMGKNRTVELKDALKDLELNVLIGNYKDAYFNYDEEKGIDPNYPGLVAVILDELAKRGQFTWRNSFGVYGEPSANTTWDETLLWGVESYDIIADYWTIQLKRMKKGVAYIEEWYDASVILITKDKPEFLPREIVLWNWLKPYDYTVWLFTIITIIASGLIYQILEWFADKRNDRSMWEWFSENCYLSFINLAQAYEYEPRTLSMRVHGVSMAIWSLIMTATYTANLASLMIDRNRPVEGVSTFEDIVHFKQKVCTWKNTNSDLFIKEKYQKVIRIPVDLHQDMYKYLDNNTCQFVADTVTSWDKHQSMRDFNPRCALKQVGEDRKFQIKAGSFAIAADSGISCTGMIRNVLDLHMTDILLNGFVVDAWEKEHSLYEDIDCLRSNPDSDLSETYASTNQEEKKENPTEKGRRLNFLRPNSGGDTIDIHQYRNLVLSPREDVIAGSVASNEEDPSKLTIQHMAGTFYFHWFLMFIALILAMTKSCYQKYVENKDNKLSQNINSTMRNIVHSVPHWKDTRSKKRNQDDTTFDDNPLRNNGVLDEIVQKYMKMNSTVCNDDDTQNKLASIQDIQASIQKTQIEIVKKTNEMFDQQQAMEQKLYELSISQVNPSDKRLARSLNVDQFVN